jgi:purine-nucleoside phosphorylase|tara:strand:- start:9568 stop:10476 length:909 start_codon:yes stop_codon:yes gene_type:complete
LSGVEIFSEHNENLSTPLKGTKKTRIKQNRMNTELDDIKDTVAFLTNKGFANAEVGIVLGTGLGNLVTKIDIEIELSYSDIPNFTLSTVEFHSGKLIYGKLGGKQVIAMQGRFHFYEGYNMNEIVFPIRVLKLLGIKNLLISNAAGAINTEFKKGELMVINDHINLQSNALIGRNMKELGTRFPDMSEPYSSQLRKIAGSVAKENSIILREGTYVSVQGPMLETAAEYRYLDSIGADAVGMSTTPEVIAANHMGLPVMAISVLTDECDYTNLQPVSIEEIIAIAGKAEIVLTNMFEGIIEKI